MKTILLLSIISLLNMRCERDFSYYYHYNPPEMINDGLKAGTLDQVGLDSTMIARAIGRIFANKYDQIHSMLIYKDDLLVFEEYFEGNKYKWDGSNYYGEVQYK